MKGPLYVVAKFHQLWSTNARVCTHPAIFAMTSRHTGKYPRNVTWYRQSRKALATTMSPLHCSKIIWPFVQNSKIGTSFYSPFVNSVCYFIARYRTHECSKRNPAKLCQTVAINRVNVNKMPQNFGALFLKKLGLKSYTCGRFWTTSRLNDE